MNPRTVTFFNRFYWPDHAATAQILTDLAQHLAQRGWGVTVVTSSSTYAGAPTPQAVDEIRNGVSIRRVQTTAAGMSATRRSGSDLAAYSAYTLRAVAACASMERPGIIVSLTDPPLLASALFPVSFIRRSRFVHWVQDIHPDVASRVGPVPSSGVAFKALRSVSRMINRAADMTVTIGPVMAAHLAAEGVPPSRLRVIPNWVDTTAVRPIPSGDNRLLRELGLGDRFVVLYSGNAGRAHPMETVVGAMSLLQHRSDIAFLFIGGGPGHEAVRRHAARENLRNAEFMDSLPRECIAESHSLAGACLVTESDDVAGLLYPSKTSGILASARPLLFVGSDASEVAAVVKAHDCGRSFRHGDSEGLAEVIAALAEDGATATRLGDNGRRAATSLFDMNTSCAAWEAALLALL